MWKIVRYKKGKGYIPIKPPFKYTYQVVLAENIDELFNHLILISQSNSLERAIKRAKGSLIKQEHSAAMYILRKGKNCIRVIPYAEVV